MLIDLKTADIVHIGQIDTYIFVFRCIVCRMLHLMGT